MRRFNLWARHRNGAEWNHGNDAGLTLVPAAIGHMRIRWNFAGLQLSVPAPSLLAGELADESVTAKNR